MFRTCLAVSILVLCVLPRARAEEPAPIADDFEVVIHGQASQGWLRSVGNAYFGKTNVGIGSFEMNEFLLNAATRSSGAVGAGIQLIAQDLGPYGNSTVQVDWAAGTVRLSDALILSAGRMRAPLGLYGATRDVDAARTSILLSQAIYVEGLRDFLSSVSGVGVKGEVALGASSLSYEAQLGVRQVPANSISLGMLKRLTLFENATEVTAGTTFAGALVFSPPVDGLRLGLSLQVVTNVEASGRPGTLWKYIDDNLGSGTFAGTDGHIRMQYTTAVFSTEYAPGPFTVGFEAQAVVPFVSLLELNLGDPLLDIFGGRYLPTPSVSAQLFASTRLTNWCEVAVRVDALGRLLPGTGANWLNDDDHYASGTLSVRFDPAPRWVLKLEAQYVNGYANVLSPEPLTATHWGVFAAKATYWF